MALIKCPECGREISDKAESCPNCGYPIKKQDCNEEANTNEKLTDEDMQECPNCHFALRPTETSCPKCGARMISGNYDYENGYYSKNSNIDLGKVKTEQKKNEQINHNNLAYISLALMLTSCLSICGSHGLSTIFSISAFITAIASFNKKFEKKTVISVTSLVISVIMFFISILSFSLTSDSDSNTATSVINTEANIQEASEIGTETNTEELETAPTTIDEQVIYQDNNVIIKVMGCEETTIGLSINLYIENNSAKNYGFNAHSYAVNGVMTKDTIYAMDCDVAAGKMANTTLFISNDFLDEYQMDCVKSIDVLFWAYDNDAMFKDFETPQIQIKTNKYDNTNYQKLGTRILNTDEMSVDYISRSGNTCYFVLTNKSGSYFDFDFTNLSINDYTVSEVDYDLYDTQILSNCQILLEINIDDDFLKQNNIETVSKMDFNITYRPIGDYFNEKTTDMITLTAF